MLRIFVDENIPRAGDFFGPFGQVTTLPGREIKAETLREADVLLVRSVTRVSADLVAGTPVKFVGTATAGTDHIDENALSELGITFSYAPGSNAASVGDYVIASILCLAASENRPLDELTCSVVGCGAVGGALSARLEHLGLRVLRSDPPLHDVLVGRGKPSPYADTDLAISEADIVTLHVPLHDASPYSTHGLFGGNRLKAMKEGAWLINTSRGAVVDELSLVRWLEEKGGSGRHAVVDVWEDEPHVRCELLRRTSIATAHIAGYASEGKLRAARMLRDSIAEWTGITLRDGDRPDPFIDLEPDFPVASQTVWMNDLVKSLYDVTADDRSLRPICGLDARERGHFFDALRRNYPERHEFSRYRLRTADVPPGLERAVGKGLGIQIQ